MYNFSEQAGRCDVFIFDSDIPTMRTRFSGFCRHGNKIYDPKTGVVDPGICGCELVIWDKENTICHFMEIAPMATLNEPIGELVLGYHWGRILSCLRENGILRLGDLVQLEPADLLKFRSFGRQMLRQVVDGLARKGLFLSSRLTGWGKPLDGSGCKSVLDECILPYRKGCIVSNQARIIRLLSAIGVNHVGSLIQMTERQCLGLSDFGVKALEMVKAFLREKGLYLGTNLVNWKAPEG